ncbi:TPA: hypothetical protein H2V82_001959 [Salmonella enterica]|nr:hypothetical protein [Salmonella enterica]
MFPAPAGINRLSASGSRALGCLPRASGDKPSLVAFVTWLSVCSPRQRG